MLGHTSTQNHPLVSGPLLWTREPIPNRNTCCFLLYLVPVASWIVSTRAVRGGEERGQEGWWRKREAGRGSEGREEEAWFKVWMGVYWLRPTAMHLDLNTDQETVRENGFWLFVPVTDWAAVSCFYAALLPNNIFSKEGTSWGHTWGN